MKDKKKYIAPELTVVSFKVEHGYAASGYGPAKAFIGLLSISGDDATYNTTTGIGDWENDNALTGW